MPVRGKPTATRKMYKGYAGDQRDGIVPKLDRGAWRRNEISTALPVASSTKATGVTCGACDRRQSLFSCRNRRTAREERRCVLEVTHPQVTGRAPPRQGTQFR